VLFDLRPKERREDIFDREKEFKDLEKSVERSTTPSPRNKTGKSFLHSSPHAYDSLPNLRIILTGSEVGLLHDFLGVDNYESPLYGRGGGEIYVRPFDEKTSKEFLRTGFREAGLDVSEDTIDRAVSILDGIPGWLVLFGVK